MVMDRDDINGLVQRELAQQGYPRDPKPADLAATSGAPEPTATERLAGIERALEQVAALEEAAQLLARTAECAMPHIQHDATRLALRQALDTYQRAREGR